MNKEAWALVLIDRLDVEDLKTLAREVISYTGMLEELDYWENDEVFFETFFQNRPMEVARAVYYGNYYYNDEWVHLDAYGNLETKSDFALDVLFESYRDEIIEEYINLVEDGSIEPHQIVDTSDTELYEESEENE